MAIPVSEIKEWLDSLLPDAEVGVDDGGLTLQEVGGSAYLEIGGTPEDHDGSMRLNRE